MNGAEGATGGFTEALADLPGAIESAFEDIPLIAVLIAAIIAAVLAAIPAVGALVGELGALPAIGFAGLTGGAAVILGMAGDFRILEAAAKSALSAYEPAHEPFTKPIENDAILLIYDAFSSWSP
jgi:hypothetical protein